jgi:hypothetical protein
MRDVGLVDREWLSVACVVYQKPSEETLLLSLCDVSSSRGEVKRGVAKSLALKSSNIAIINL